MSWESEENKKWDAKPLYWRLGYACGCIILGVILLPLALIIGLSERAYNSIKSES